MSPSNLKKQTKTINKNSGHSSSQSLVVCVCPCIRIGARVRACRLPGSLPTQPPPRPLPGSVPFPDIALRLCASQNNPRFSVVSSMDHVTPGNEQLIPVSHRSRPLFKVARLSSRHTTIAGSLHRPLLPTYTHPLTRCSMLSWTAVGAPG